MYVISCGNSSGIESLQQHYTMETIMTLKNVKKLLQEKQSGTDRALLI